MGGDTLLTPLGLHTKRFQYSR